MNLFKKMSKAISNTVTEVAYPQVVQEIHNEFFTAGDKLLAESKTILEECAKVDKQKGSLLQSLGFVNTPQAKMISETQRKEAEAKELAQLVSMYAVEYPNNKFITRDMVEQICKKYSLVCGGVELYKGFVPADKLEQIAAFKLKEKHECVTFSNGVSVEGGEVLLIGEYYHVFERNNYNRFNYAFQSDDGIKFYADDSKNIFGLKYLGNLPQKTFLVKGFQICAPIKDMDTKGMELKGYFLEKHIPDPVVLQPVKGGFLIVAAWGDEASDELVVNQSSN